MRDAKFLTALGEYVLVDRDLPLALASDPTVTRVAADCHPDLCVVVLVRQTVRERERVGGKVKEVEREVSVRAMRDEADWRWEVRSRLGEEDRPLHQSHRACREAVERDRFRRACLARFFTRLMRERALTEAEAVEAAKVGVGPKAKRNEPRDKTANETATPFTCPDVLRAASDNVPHRGSFTAGFTGGSIAFHVHDIENEERAARVAKAVARLAEDELDLGAAARGPHGHVTCDAGPAAAAAHSHVVEHLLGLGYDYVTAIR